MKGGFSTYTDKLKQSPTQNTNKEKKQSGDNNYLIPSRACKYYGWSKLDYRIVLSRSTELFMSKFLEDRIINASNLKSLY